MQITIKLDETEILMQGKSYKYIFSIVMAVYNCEPFLRETLDSIVNQQINKFYRYENGKTTKNLVPFEEIVQVIMVDDGSKDSSGAICDEYAEKYPNFKAVHKVNGGVASARNEGLLHVEGKYMNFLDSDDTFSVNVLLNMYNFFEEHYEETDVITMPLIFFDAAKGSHWQNYKFGKHARVANLYNDHDCPLMFVNASFFKSEYKDKVRFSDKLVCGEDIRFINEILSEKMTLGLVPYCHYNYRRRSVGEESLIQTSKKKLGWYFDYFTYLVDWTVDLCNKKWGYIPAYYQNILVCDIKWRFLNEYEKDALEVVGEDGFEEYRKTVAKALSYFDDKYILDQRGIWNEHKYLMLKFKYGRHADLCLYDDDARLRYGNTMFCWLSGCYSLIDFIKIKDGALTVEGYTTMLGCDADEPLEITLAVTEEGSGTVYYPCTPVTEREVNQRRMGEVVYPTFAFVGKIPLADINNAKISLVCFFRGKKIVKKDIRFGKFSPIGKEINNSYYANEGYLLTRAGYFLYLKKASKKQIHAQDKLFMKELKSTKKLGSKKAYYAIKAARITSFFKKKKIWLISDRADAADDNGEALFRYISENKPKGVEVYFVIDGASSDFERLKKYGNVVSFGSHKHKFLYLLADRIILSHTDDYILNPFGKFFTPYRSYISEKKFVFLQHGITKNDISKWFNRYRINLSAFITSAEKERNSILEYAYGYSDEQVAITGFARYDYLYNDPKKIITVAPTWRAYLLTGGGYSAITPEKFKSSRYFEFYNDLFANERLKAALSEYGYEILFKPHPRMMPYIDLFRDNESFRMIDESVNYKTLFATSSILVTDYSSTMFDFAYLKKPVILCQFDKEEFYSGNHTIEKGYFDDEEMGFGEIACDIEGTIDLLIEYMQNGCKIKEKYKKRIDSFFKYNDKDNCKRIVEKILSLK